MKGAVQTTLLLLTAGCLLLASCTQSLPPAEQSSQPQPKSQGEAHFRHFEIDGEAVTAYEALSKMPDRMISLLDARLKRDIKRHLTPEQFNTLSLAKRHALNGAVGKMEPQARTCLSGADQVTGQALSFFETVRQISAEELIQFDASTKSCITETLTPEEFSRLTPAQQQAIRSSLLL